MLKEPKIYFFDTGLVNGDDGAKLENFVASSLLKYVYAKVDYHAKEYGLHHMRTKDGLEVDFALSFQDEVESIIEVKLSDSTPSKALVSFHEKYEYPAIQLVKTLRHQQSKSGIDILSAEKFLSNLFL